MHARSGIESQAPAFRSEHIRTIHLATFWLAAWCAVVLGACAGSSSPAGGSPGGIEPEAEVSFVEAWAEPSTRFDVYRGPRSTGARQSLADAETRDGLVLALSLGAGVAPSPGGGPGARSIERFGYGRFSARLKAADAKGQPRVGLITAFFLYGREFGAQDDLDADGIPDNPEIDFEWLAAEPGSIWLTAFTDYRDSDGVHRRVARKVNLREGRIEYTIYEEEFGKPQTLFGSENQPEHVRSIPDYDASGAYYEYGIDRLPDRLVWWMLDPSTGERVTLWDYRGPPERRPGGKLAIMANLWHSETWAPEAVPDATEAPRSRFEARFDELRYEPLP